MPTGDTKVEINQKKLMGLLDLRDGLLEYVDQKIEEAISKLYTEEGLFETVDLDITGNDEISLDPTSFQLNDGAGNTMDTSGLTGSLVSGVPFENENAIVYHVGLAYVEIASGVLENPRTGDVEYRFAKDWIGNKAEPDSVVDNTGSLTFVVDSVLEASRDNTGRTVSVYLKTDPQTDVEAEAIVQATVYFDAGSNKIDVAHYMGQTTPSTTAADYWVVLEGPRIERDTDLRLEAGVVYVGNVTGGGSGNPPSAKDLDDQYVYTDPALVFGDIVEVDANNHHKVAVKAYSAEADSWPQISVVPEGGTDRTMQIQKDGSVLIGNDNHAAGDAKPDLVLYRAGPKSLTAQRGTNRWELLCDPTSDGLYVDSGYLTIQDQLNAVTTLQFFDTNTPSAVFFSSGSDTALDADLPTNILGAINWQRTIETGVDHRHGTACLDGGTCDLPGGGAGRVFAGTFIVNGQLVSVPVFNQAVAVDTYVYLNSQATPPVYATTTTLPLPHADDLPMAFFPTSVGSPTDAISMRKVVNNLGDRTDLVVGTTGASGTQLPEAHFATVSEACRAIKEYADPTAGTGEGRQFRILVAGYTEEPSGELPIPVPPGTVIEGVRDKGLITWDADNRLFDIVAGELSTNAGHQVFRNLVILFNGSGTLPTSAPYRSVFYADSAIPTSVKIEHVTVYSPTYEINGVIEVGGTAVLSSFHIEGVQCSIVSDWGFYMNKATSGVIKDCRLSKRSGETQQGSLSGSGIHIYEDPYQVCIDNCWVNDFEESGIELNDNTGAGAGQVRITNCIVNSCNLYGIYLEDCDRSVLIGNIITDCDYNGVRLQNSEQCLLLGNTIRDCSLSQPVTASAVATAGSSDRCILVGNDLDINTGGAQATKVAATGFANGVAVGNNFNAHNHTLTASCFYQTATASDPLNQDV